MGVLGLLPVSILLLGELKKPKELVPGAPDPNEPNLISQMRAVSRSKPPAFKAGLALLNHGRYTKQAKQERLEWRELLRGSTQLLVTPTHGPDYFIGSRQRVGDAIKTRGNFENRSVFGVSCGS
jgi:hypothetical protein